MRDEDVSKLELDNLGIASFKYKEKVYKSKIVIFQSINFHGKITTRYNLKDKGGNIFESSLEWLNYIIQNN